MSLGFGDAPYVLGFAGSQVVTIVHVVGMRVIGSPSSAVEASGGSLVMSTPSLGAGIWGFGALRLAEASRGSMVGPVPRVIAQDIGGHEVERMLSDAVVFE